MSAVPKKAVKLNHSLTHYMKAVLIGAVFAIVSGRSELMLKVQTPYDMW